ncbi:cytochrome P450 [Mycobacterium sp. pW049]|uniref:cytochrome P450 n=1 Tax=[Mycobacterium] bulgaricum TaxID=3238985 RepID=UPI00351B9CF3
MTDLGAALFDEEFLQDPYPLYARMHARAPLHRVADSDFYVVCGWDAVTEALARTEDFSSNLTGAMRVQPDGTVGLLPMDGLGSPSHALATADDPAHAVHRRMLLPQLSGRRIRALEAYVTDTMDELWSGVAGDRVEWMSTVANRLPMMVVCHLIGVPGVDVDRITAWAYASTQILEGRVDDSTLASAGAAALELGAYIAGHMTDVADDPPDNLLGVIATACAAGELELVTGLAIMLTLFGAGGESTASLIGSAVGILATRPELQSELRADPARIPAFLEEVLRYEPPFRGHYRHVLTDCDLAGARLPEGSRLLLLWGAANRDPAHVDDPDEFRIDRPDSKAHLAFGRGAHFCVGAALARLEARIVLQHLLERTSHVEMAEPGRWLPSLLVRRPEKLPLQIK